MHVLTTSLLLQASPESSKIDSIPPPLNIPPSRARRQLAARLAAKKEASAAESDPDAADSAALDVASRLPQNPDEGDIDLGPATEREIREGTSASSPTSGLNITGLRTVSGLGETASRVSGLFGGSDSSDDSNSYGDLDEDDAGRDLTANRPEGDYEDSSTAERMSPVDAARRQKPRRPGTTEAKERVPLDDEDEDAESLGKVLDAKLVLAGDDDRGPFADPVDMRDDSSDEDELVEIRPRRTS